MTLGGYGISDDDTNLPFGRVQANSLADEVATQLYNAITMGLLRPGERVVEANLSRQMGVSRAPIREATRMLVERGMLVQIPRRGVFVREYDKKEIEEINELRLTIELGAMTRAMSGGYLLQLDLLEQILVMPASTDATDRAASALEFELSLHREIVRLYPNDRFQRAFDEVADELRVAMAGFGLSQASTDCRRSESAPLVRAIRAHNLELAVSLLTESVKDLAVRFMEAQPSRKDAARPHVAFHKRAVG